jgi:hypothetical protein
MKEYDLSLVISYYGRPSALSMFVEHWRALNLSLEIVLSEQTPDGETTVPSNLKIDQHHLFVDKNEFSTAFLKNWGIIQATGKVIFPVDLEMVPFTDFPWSDVITKITEPYPIFLTPIRKNSVTVIPKPPIMACTGDLMIPRLAALRSTWLVTGGYDFRFRGWGCEDNEFFQRAKRRIWLWRPMWVLSKDVRPCMWHVNHKNFPSHEYQPVNGWWVSGDKGPGYIRNQKFWYDGKVERDNKNFLHEQLIMVQKCGKKFYVDDIKNPGFWARLRRSIHGL